MSRINAFLELTVKQGGSDLHVVAGEQPRVRIHGKLEPVRFRELATDEILRILSEFMTDEQRARLDRDQNVDFAYKVEGLGRFRANVYQHVRGIAAVFRVIPDQVPTLEAAGLPAVVASMVANPRGLTLVTGPTGSGKSTTLAAMIDHVNRTRKGHIITIEDPVEFIHPFHSCVVTQREIGAHSPSFRDALKDALREDPDVILVGEMRDLETIELALTAAETGVQVFGTLHTTGAVRTVDRLVSVFPARVQDQIRAVLAESLRMIVSQQLARKADGTGRVLVPEILVNTQGCAAMIRKGRAHQLTTVIQSGARDGMCSLDARLHELVKKEVISGEEAFEKAIEKAAFERYLLEEITI
ncbi:MAG: type IV pilus twitching motility protein PilT [bacterium]